MTVASVVMLVLGTVAVLLVAGAALYTLAVYGAYAWVRGGGAGGMQTTPADRPWRALVVEFLSAVWLTGVGLFTAPWSRVRLARGNPNGVPVLCIHGYTQNWGNWLLMAPRLARAGSGPVYAINVRNMFGSIEGGAAQAAESIRAILAETGKEQVDLVCHSMGGLIARTALARHGVQGLVRHVVTLGTPHTGTVLAAVGPGSNAREMRRDSAFLKELPLAHAAYTSVWSTTDGIVLPPDSSSCGVPEVVFHDLGHLSLLMSPRVHAVVAGVLTSTPGGSAVAQSADDRSPVA
jgi:triacylglycerol esterase/lipase EstA (alpha/beta hydrolase family)